MADRKSVLVRLRPEVYAALQRWAADEFRSVNGQIEFIFEQALREAGRRPTGPDETGASGDPPAPTEQPGTSEPRPRRGPAADEGEST